MKETVGMETTYCGWCGDLQAGNHRECEAALSSLADSLVIEALGEEMLAQQAHAAARHARRAAGRLAHAAA